MTRIVRLSSTAKVRLREISEWTSQNFGALQARSYGAGLIAVADQIASGTIRGRSCRKVWGDGISAGLLYVPAKSHLIIFVETEGEIVVTNILHKSMDIPGHLGS